MNTLINMVEHSTEYNCQYDIDEANYLLGLIFLQDQNLDRARKYLKAADEEGDHRSAQEILRIVGR